MGNGSLIVTSLRWNGDEALKLMSRADELEVRETVKMGRCQDMEPNILNTSKHSQKKNCLNRTLFCHALICWDQGMHVL